MAASKKLLYVICSRAKTNLHLISETGRQTRTGNPLEITPELKESRVGTYLGSGYRSTQSTYALALSMLSKIIDIPTDIIIIDENNSPRYIKHSKKLIVQPHEVTQNVSLELADRMLEDTIKAYGVIRDQKIKCIMIDKPQVN